MVFKRTTGAYKRICLFNSKWIVEKEKYPKYIIRAEFYQFLSLLLMWSLITIQQRSENGYVFLSPGLKTGVENGRFWSEIGSGFGEPGGTPLPKIPRSTPPPTVQKTHIYMNVTYFISIVDPCLGLQQHYYDIKWMTKEFSYSMLVFNNNLVFLLLKN